MIYLRTATKVALLAAAISTAFADEHRIQDAATSGPTIWSGDKTFTGNFGWPGTGIFGEMGYSETINTDGNINASGNERGILMLGGSSATFTSSDPGKTFSTDNNMYAGISVEDNSNLTINNMNVGSSGNTSVSGLQSTGGGKVNINNAANITLNDNSNSGVHTSGNGSEINITGKSDDSSTLSVSGNNAGSIWSAGMWSENGGLINIENTSVEVSNNGLAGIMLWDGGKFQISGNGNHALQVTGNGIGRDGGVIVKRGSTFDITDMNAQIDNNGTYGMQIAEEGVATIVGSSGVQYTLSASGNELAGLAAMNLNSVLNIVGMNIKANDNGTYGLRATDGGVINVTGANGNTLDVVGYSGNEGNGIVAYSASGNSQSQINIVDMNILIDDQAYQGIAAREGGAVSISSTSGTNLLEIYNTRMATNYGQDLGKGIHAKEIDGNSGKASTVIIKDMNIISNDNELEGVVAANGGVIYIESAAGNNTLTANGNRNYAAGDPANWTYGSGILAHSASSIDGTQAATIIIKNMDIEASDNGLYGIQVRNGAQMLINSSKGNTLTISNNRTGNSGGTGISVADVSNGIRAQLDIQDMNVFIDSSADAGISAGGGALINITSSTGTNMLTANGNDNYGNNYNEGAGIWAFGADSADPSTLSTVNLIGLDIEAKNNGSYGIVSEGGHINIAGNGAHTLNLDGNGRYGLLAKDGGSADISGMVISGASLDHSFVAIEREGLIQLTNSSVTTDTDTLFYTWSDSNTQTGKYVLNNVSAVGNGTKLAYFNSHNGVLEAANSYLENAIVTDPGAGVTSTVSLDTSTWLMKDSSNITNLTVSDSVVDMRKSSGYSTLTLDKLTSGNSTYHLNTYFDYAGLTTDKIIVDGNDATGAGNVLAVHSTGYENGTSAVNGFGIQVINLDGATDKSIDFSLLGGVVDSGAYEYWLYRAADDNYYLQTDYRATTTADTIINVPAIHLSLVKTGLDEFRKRITELREYDKFHPEEVWVRAYGKRLKVSDTIDSKMSIYGIEVGYDSEVYQNEDNKYYVGVMAGYQYTDNIVHHNAGRPNGTANAKTPSIGLYGVWDSSDGWYSYATLRHFWSNMEATNYTSLGESISYKPNRNFIAATFELGKQFEYIVDEDRKWIIEPKGELRYAYAKSNSFETSAGNKIRYGSSKSFTTRGAVLLGYNYKSGSNAVYEPFVEVGVSKEWMGDTDVTYAGGAFQSEQKGSGFDAAVGVRTKINDKWSVLVNANYEKGSVHKGIGGQLAVRYSWE